MSNECDCEQCTCYDMDDCADETCECGWCECLDEDDLTEHTAHKVRFER